MAFIFLKSRKDYLDLIQLFVQAFEIKNQLFFVQIVY
jgi:hypothetical protein